MEWGGTSARSPPAKAHHSTWWAFTGGLKQGRPKMPHPLSAFAIHIFDNWNMSPKPLTGKETVAELTELTKRVANHRTTQLIQELTHRDYSPAGTLLRLEFQHDWCTPPDLHKKLVEFGVIK
jgi:hypothetical protein